MKHPCVPVLDFGGQYTQLIARRVRENHVYSMVVPPDVSPETLRDINAVGLILSGGPASVYDESSPRPLAEVLRMGLPILGICYGMHAGCEMLGAAVRPTKLKEFGRTHLTIVRPDKLLQHLPSETTVWMSHGDVVTELGEDFVALAHTASCPLAAVKHRDTPFYGVQFHPEVTHTLGGQQILRNFLYDICGGQGTWQVGNFIAETLSGIRDRVGAHERVICALSGGVDSSVTAALLHEAVGDRLVCIFVDNGLLRQGERELVEGTFRDHFRIDLHVVDAAERFLSKLAGVADPQQKRRIIGREFIEVFRNEARSVENARYLAQGTLYPDVIESGHSSTGVAASIKIHHNVGGLPEELGFELIEPLRDLFKDEARRVAEHLGLPPEIVWRHPFPGPGLAVRIVGPVTREGLAILREADQIVLEELRLADWYRKVAQAFAVLLPVSSVGVMGDGRSYEGQHVIAVRVVETADFMTADWAHLDYDVLGRISTRIINEVPHVNRVVYDVSTKPPATIEWE